MDVADLQVANQSPPAPLAEEGNAPAWLLQHVRQDQLSSDSRFVRPGGVFVAVRGVHSDGHDFVEQAVAAGAAVVVAERPVPVPAGVRLVQVENSAAALGVLAQAAWGEPASALMVLGVTGTNGKTTVACLTQQILKSAGIGCGLLGTVSYDVGQGEPLQAANTTPDGPRMAELMAQMRQNGLEAVVMECSSHGLDQQRTAGLTFQAAAFTNLSGDHLDYHKNRHAYLAAKSRLFTCLGESAAAVLNAEDPASAYLAQRTGAQVWRYGIAAATEQHTSGTDGAPLDITADITEMGVWGSRFHLTIGGRTVPVRSRLIGRHNVSNALAAAGLATAAGVALEAIAAGIEQLSQVPGRLESIPNDLDVTVLVDYAHTDDALDHALSTVRQLSRGRVLVVFGCGGDRDRTKRRRMASVAQRWADRIVVTNDNPRSEEAASIIDEIRAGFSAAARAKVVEIPDRRMAIGYAIDAAGPGDVVLIAGKGHEDYQIVGTQRLPFDDRQVAREALAVRAGQANGVDSDANVGTY